MQNGACGDGRRRPRDRPRQPESVDTPCRNQCPSLPFQSAVRAGVGVCFQPRGSGPATPKTPGVPKLTRIYTRTGDDGTTGLVGGQRVKKNALRIETYGTVYELSSIVGLTRTALVDARRKSQHANEAGAELDSITLVR